MQEFSINQVTKITGLSRSTLLYYENKGLIAPQQSSRSGYRKYNMSDISQIIFYQSLKPLGISVEEYAGIINKSEGSYMNTYDLILLKKADYMKRLAVYLSMWEDTLVLMHMLQHSGVNYQIKESLDAWALLEPCQQGDIHQEVLKNWNHYFFQRNISYFFDSSSVQNHDYRYQTGLTCYADCALTLPEEIRLKLMYIPSNLCLLLIMPIDLTGNDFAPLFGEVSSILRKEQLEIAGNPWGSLGYRGEFEGKITDYFFLWLPVKGKVLN